VYEIDFLPVGDGQDSGDAIAIRFTRPENGRYAHVVIDAGYQKSGEALVDHVQGHYGTDTIDLAVLTHPDADHIGGMGTVVRELDVGVLCVHRLGERGGAGLAAGDAVDELIDLAESRGTHVHEPWPGDTACGGAIRFLGPDEAWYEQLVEEQIVREISKAGFGRGRLLEAARALSDRLMSYLPVEVPFDEGDGTSPRNETSIITMLELGDFRAVFTGDAGVEALERAWDYLDASGRGTWAPNFIQVPHHGSRRNASSATLDRLLGPTEQAATRTAFVSVVANAPKHPAGRVVNAYARRGYRVFPTAGRGILEKSPDAPPRSGWVSLNPLGPMDEDDD
jgi:beta-lactamase superfamily II metal-dependent hydrolase